MYIVHMTGFYYRAETNIQKAGCSTVPLRLSICTILFNSGYWLLPPLPSQVCYVSGVDYPDNKGIVLSGHLDSTYWCSFQP